MSGAEVDQVGLPEAEPIGLPEVDADEAIFRSSGIRIQLPGEGARHPRVHLVTGLIIISALFGILNGLDFIDGDRGLINHRELVLDRSIGKPDRSAILSGQLVLVDGTPAFNYSIRVFVIYNRSTEAEEMLYVRTVTDAEGRFRLDDLNPGLHALEIQNLSDKSEGVTHRVLLTGPELFEAYGFTYLRLDWPSEAEFDRRADPSNPSIRWIDYREEERGGGELFDETAANFWVMVGFGFLGASTLALIMALVGWRSASPGLLRTASVLVFFSQGHYYAACCGGLMAGLLTIGLIPRRPKRVEELI
jgi:hypothetical protein